MFEIRHSLRISHAHWTYGLVELQKKNLGTHLIMFPHDISENWSIQVNFFAHTHNTQPLSHLNISPNELIFHTQPPSPLNFN